VLENFDWATGTWPSLTGLRVYNIPTVRGPDTLRIVCIISRTVYFYTIETSRAVAQAGSSVRQIPDESNILLCSSSIQTAPVELKIFQPEEPSLDAEHTRQLGQHLIRWRAELEAAQADFDDQQKRWSQQQEVEQQDISLRHKTLQQRERQVRSLESQLLQLQNDVIDGQAALQTVSEKISNDGFLHVVDGEKIAALEDLRFEISERFDYLVERWQRFRDSQAN